MKVLQIPFCYYPDPVGGTEIYVESLAQHLKLSGIESVVAAPGERSTSYEHNGFRVRRFGVGKSVDNLNEIYGKGDAEAAREFARILDVEKPDAIHLHAFTSAASLRIVREAKLRGIKAVFTYHTPGASCQRGTLLRWGNEVCEGALDPQTCAACSLHGRGMNKLGSVLLSHLPARTEQMIEATGLTGKPWTALRMRGLTDMRQSAFKDLLAEVDAIVALSEWSNDLLLRNGADSHKVTLSPHGLCGNCQESARGHHAPDTQSLRIAFLSRIDPIKGADVLIRAVRTLPDLAIELDIYNAAASPDNAFYSNQLKQLAAGDTRIRFLPPLPHWELTEILRNYHLLAVPSRCLETGPLVVLEAFEAGLPVVGSNLGGIAELVENEVNGLLVNVDSVQSWNSALARLCTDQGLLERLRLGVRRPRRMKTVAEEMTALYQQLTHPIGVRAAVAGV